MANTDPEPLSAEQAIREAQEALRRGDCLQARRMAALAARLDSANEPPRFKETPWLILAALGCPRASVGYLREALAINPDSPAARKGLAWAEERLREASEAPTIPVKRIGPAVPIAQAQPEGEVTRPVATRRKKLALAARKLPTSALSRVARFGLVRAVTLLAMVAVALFLIIYIANLGGYLDTINKAVIDEDITYRLASGWLKGKPEEERQQIIEQTRQAMREATGLNEPYLVRCLDWFRRGISLDWGKSRYNYYVSATIENGLHSHEIYTDDIRQLILSYLPRTLLLLGLANFALFLISVFIALALARSPGGWLDKTIVALAPTSSAPAWLYGLVLYIFLFKVLGIYSIKLGFSDWPTNFNLALLPAILKGLALPFFAILISKLFQSIYAWRNYFLIFSGEDYVELAKAKGLPAGVLERRYLLRPALPGILTSFALILINMWQDCIAVEYFFNIQGIGGLFAQALNGGDIAIVVGLVACFAYLLAVTVLILDILYAIIDPRIKIGKETGSDQPLRGKIEFNFSLRPFREAFQSLKTALSDGAHSTRVLRLRFGNGPDLAEIGESIRRFYREIARYPSAVTGLSMILILSIISAATVIAIPYDRAMRLWLGGSKTWYRNPIEVPPAWTNVFRKEKLPENIELSSLDGTAHKVKSTTPGGTRQVAISFPFDYSYSAYPQDILVQFSTQSTSKNPFVMLSLVTPDGKEIKLKNTAVSQDTSYMISQDQALSLKLKAVHNIDALFTRPGQTPGTVRQGRYELKVNAILFEEGSDLDADLVVYGKVYGVAGTDLQRRDLSLALLWGSAVALAFGMLAAIGTTFTTITLAAASAWFGGWLDGLIQRISEVNMILPMLPTSILIFYLYSKSFWVILGVTVILSIFGNSLKTYRAMFLQIVESPYIEAAYSYGASNWRIIWQYLIPRMRMVLIPQLVILVPSYIFLEATLAFLGVSDPFLPTMGKLLVDTMRAGIFNKAPYLSLEPAGMLIFISLGFALFGIALERMVKERMG